jgi:hypothetical protein
MLGDKDTFLWFPLPFFALPLIANPKLRTILLVFNAKIDAVFIRFCLAFSLNDKRPCLEFGLYLF